MYSLLTLFRSIAFRSYTILYYRDEIILTLGKDANVLSLTYMPKISPLAPSTCDEYPAYSTDDSGSGIKVPSLQSDVSWETDIPGMVLQTVLPKYNPPPGLKYIKSTNGGGGGSNSKGGSAGTIPSGATMTTSDKPPPSITGKGGSGGDGDGDEPPELDNSFMGLAKRYWYVLLPLILSNFLTGQEAPKEGGAGGAGEGATSGVAAAAAGGVAAAGAAAGSAQVRQRRGKRG